MGRRVSLLLLAAGLASAQEGNNAAAAERTTPYPAREAGKKPATVPIKKKVFSFPVPADWVLRDVEEPKAELAWTVLLPGSTERAELWLVRDEHLANPRSAPYYHKEAQTWEGETGIRPSPVPRLIVTRPGGDWINAYFFCAVRNNPYYFHLSCADEDFAQAEQDMIAAVQGFAADVATWPPIPKGYETKQEGIWLVAKAPSLTAPLAPVVAGLKEAEKRFKRQHGTLPKGDAIVVLVVASASDAKKIEPEAGDDGFYADAQHRRILAVPVANLEQQGWLAGVAHGLLLVAKYGDTRPELIWMGERTVAQAEAMTGKPLPSLDEGFVSWISNLKLHTLDELEEIKRSDRTTYAIESFFYVAMLQAGEHKKAYQGLLKEFGETGDGVAFARSLLAIGQEELRTATNEFVMKIKPEKRKERKPK